ncbi:type II 3-dehydroquinate dehydratase [Alkalihalobacterium chitinilyticum]|uniref:3-dehydroquinate dehydratase n=1 Tax=Alkalihalobacterium chitinilyticum TaxID=2980103 RepID=A0ABT5VAV0_9BACI|nr:type II 3-dehydroquinate dehydratase [Alkalihalobacterium chitinilyticum]MDE5412261.1 type II 3-dehydroquinate dehydratase [Alkalihalobacterium chitinilyticum]
MNSILVINGPNLNRLGMREPDIYGHETLADLESRLVEYGKGLGYEVVCKQSNFEGQIIDWIHEAQETGCAGIVVNPGAFTHYSYAIRDAVASISVPVIEVHISNVHARETFRHTSVISPVTRGQIVGLGFTGYELAIQAIIKGGS